MTEERGRTARQDEERQQRRRRSDTTIDGGQRMKLAIPPEVEQRLKAEGRTPRWVIKDSARMAQLTQQDDYDRVDGVDSVATRSLRDGERIEMILLSKPTAFVEEDKAKLDEPRREVERALLRGRNPQDPIAGNDSFYADSANQISHGGRRSP